MQVFLWSAMYLDVLQPGSALQCLHSKKVFFVFEILSKACIYSDNRWKIIARKINLAGGGQGAGDGWGAGSGWGSASSLNTYECCWITTSSFGKIPPYSFVIAFAFCLTVFFLYKPQYQAHEQEYQQNTTIFKEDAIAIVLFCWKIEYLQCKFILVALLCHKTNIFLMRFATNFFSSQIKLLRRKFSSSEWQFGDRFQVRINFFIPPLLLLL